MAAATQDGTLDRCVDGEAALFGEVVLGVDRAGRTRELAGPVRAIAPRAHFRLVHVSDAAVDQVATRFGEASPRAGDLLTEERVDGGLPSASIENRFDQTVASGLARAAAGADLLVVGAPCRVAATASRAGRVARDLFHRTPGPVMFVPSGCRDLGDRPHVLGVAFDGSPEALRALDVGIDISRTTGAELQICRAVEATAHGDWDGDAFDEYAAALLAAEELRLSKLAADCEVPAHVEVREGHAGDVLAALARRCDILVCGSHGWGPSARAAFGSTADDLIGRLQTPLLVVPRGLPGSPRFSSDRGDRHAAPTTPH